MPAAVVPNLRDLNQLPIGEEAARDLVALIGEAQSHQSIQSSRIAMDDLGYATEVLACFTHETRTYGILLQRTTASDGWILRVVPPESLGVSGESCQLRDMPRPHATPEAPE